MQSFHRENIDGAVDADLRVAEQISASTLSFSVLNSEGAVLADEMGCGKTMQACMYSYE